MILVLVEVEESTNIAVEGLISYHMNNF
jgi:hypothetical protein